jgi:hypothetical protein
MAEVINFHDGGDGNRALLYEPVMLTPWQLRACVVLVPGGDGNVVINGDGTIATGPNSLQNNQVVRTRTMYDDAIPGHQDIAALLIDKSVKVADAVKMMSERFSRPVIIVANSRGSLRVPDAIRASAPVKPYGVALLSGFLNELSVGTNSVAFWDTQIPVLVVHHKWDGCCLHTPPASVEPFVGWLGARARLHSLEGLPGEVSIGDPCKARSFHGFWNRDDEVVQAVKLFVRSIAPPVSGPVIG